MEITLDELLKGKATKINNNNYLPTEAYITPFIERLHNITNDFRIQVKLPRQITLTKDNSINMEDITYNRVWIQAVLPDELTVKNHKQVIGMVYGLDVKQPVYKIYSGGLNMACTNLCVFNPDSLEISDLNPGSAMNFKPLTRMIEETETVSKNLRDMLNIPFSSDRQNTSEQLGEWIKRCMSTPYDNGFGVVKLATSVPIEAYKMLYSNKKSPYYVGENDTNMFNVYNAFTQCITNSLEKDLLNQCEKTILLRQILNV